MPDGFVLNSWGPPPVPTADTPAPAMAGAYQGGLAASPVAVPPAPPGVNVPEFRKETAKKIADEDDHLREKALSSMEFLGLSPKVKQIYRDSPDVFGPWVGTTAYNDFVRSPAAATSSFNPFASDSAANMEKFNQVQGATKQLSTLGLKAAFGSRISNVDVAQHNAMFGGAGSASAESAVKSLERMEQQHMNTLQSAVDRGLVDPSRVPRDVVELGIKNGQLNPSRFLPRIASPADAARLPSGSLFVNPDGKVLKVP